MRKPEQAPGLFPVPVAIMRTAFGQEDTPSLSLQNSRTHHLHGAAFTEVNHYVKANNLPRITQNMINLLSHIVQWVIKHERRWGSAAGTITERLRLEEQKQAVYSLLQNGGGRGYEARQYVTDEVPNLFASIDMLLAMVEGAIQLRTPAGLFVFCGMEYYGTVMPLLPNAPAIGPEQAQVQPQQWLIYNYGTKMYLQRDKATWLPAPPKGEVHDTTGWAQFWHLCGFASAPDAWRAAIYTETETMQLPLHDEESN